MMPKWMGGRMVAWRFQRQGDWKKRQTRLSILLVHRSAQGMCPVASPPRIFKSRSRGSNPDENSYTSTLARRPLSCRLFGSLSSVCCHRIASRYYAERRSSISVSIQGHVHATERARYEPCCINREEQRNSNNSADVNASGRGTVRSSQPYPSAKYLWCLLEHGSLGPCIVYRTKRCPSRRVYSFGPEPCVITNYNFGFASHNRTYDVAHVQNRGFSWMIEFAWCASRRVHRSLSTSESTTPPRCDMDGKHAEAFDSILYDEHGGNVGM